MAKHNRSNKESENGKGSHEGSDDDSVNEGPGQSEFDDEIGYGKPPKKSQFKKGTSGNPQGRPRGSRNLDSQLKPLLREKVMINENGCRKSITKVQAAFKQQLNKAASGDRHALQLIISLLRSLDGAGKDMPAQISAAEVDQKIVEDFVKRCNSNITGDDNEPKSE